MSMNRNNIRAAVIGVTAGVTAGAATIAGIIAVDDYDLWHKAGRAAARWRLLPADRAELDRLRADRTDRDSDLRDTHITQTAMTRWGFRPGLLLPHHLVTEPTELLVPALITEIERAVHQCTRMTGASNWPGHRDALIDEFRRRRTWAVEVTLPELDQLRLDAAADHVQGLAVDAVIRYPALSGMPTGSDYPTFEGPFDTNLADTDRE
ncbi:hypothetical protein ACQP1O_33195 [Nocardia sp. CA-151230]|uniref:hypothetical protein n=1 Tax=Nocardia sp. CA-151230 TaxID=3239982 RepID=UPI003D8F0938